MPEYAPLDPLVSLSPYLYYSYQTPIYDIKPTVVHSPIYHSPIYRRYSHQPSIYSSSLRNLQVSFNRGYLPAFGLGPVDIFQQTRTQAESIKNTIRYLAGTPGSAQYTSTELSKTTMSA